MDNEQPIVNRVASSSLVTFDLERFYVGGERVVIDIKDQLYEGVMLREKDFRSFIKDTSWETYSDKFVAVTCSADAIVPVWAYMMVCIALQPYAKFVVFGALTDLNTALFRKSLQAVDWSVYTDSKVVIKGCSKVDVPETIYLETAASLKPYAASIMFGEPCSTVPLFKRGKNL